MFNRIVKSVLRKTTSNPISAAGAVLTSGGIILLMLFALVFTFMAKNLNPYFAALGFLGLPPFIFLVSALIPIGNLILKRRREDEPFWIRNFNIRNEKVALYIFGFFTLIFVALLGLIGVQAGSFMNSIPFCGQTCHSVMEPEAVAHSLSTHSITPCVSCHVGEGVEQLIVSKWRGVGRVVALITNSYERPIPTPVTSLPSSEDTCKKCHNTDKEVRSNIKVIRTYMDDEKNSPLVSAISMKTGSSKKGSAHGVHAHGSSDLTIRYYSATPDRKNINWIESIRKEQITIWSYEGEAPPPVKTVQSTSKGRAIYIIEGVGVMRAMDCIDCHNRIGHDFKKPEELVDDMLLRGEINPGLPYAKKTAMKALSAAAQGKKEAIAKKINDIVTAAWPFDQRADNVANILTEAANRYLYPDMNITWGKYSNLNSHSRDEGCFRCHNQRMKNSKNENLSQDCDKCHITMADQIPLADWEKSL